MKVESKQIKKDLKKYKKQKKEQQTTMIENSHHVIQPSVSTLVKTVEPTTDFKIVTERK